MQNERHLHIMGATVKDLIEALSVLPDNSKVYCCGYEDLWLHFSMSADGVNIDTEQYID